MTQKRLNDLMVLNIHKQKTDLLNLADVAKEFVSSRENRVRLFGNFKLSSWVFTVSLLSYFVYDTFCHFKYLSELFTFPFWWKEAYFP